jgi:ParB/RepB/Spo0J family partition protein
MSENVKPIEIETAIVPIESVLPNHWNPNQMDERTYQAALESIREYGFIDPVTVRPHPQQQGKWEILDGEHRQRAAAEEGYREIQINNVGPISDAAAKKLTLIFNETRGEADVTLLGHLIVDLNRELEDRALLMLGLPYSDAEIENLLQIGEVDWDSWEQGEEEKSGRIDSPDGTQHTVFMHFDDEQYEKFQAYTDMVQREREQPDVPSAVLLALRELAESF